MAEWDWRVSWWLFWRVFKVLVSSGRRFVSNLWKMGDVLWCYAGGRHTLE